MYRRFIVLFVSMFACCSLFAQEQAKVTLATVFEEIAALDGFQTVERKEIEDATGQKLGACKGTIHGNASHREEVLRILSELPEGMLYSENRTSNDKITRVYIEEGGKKSSRMLYTFIGWAGNDLVVLLYSGGNLKKYKEFGDSIKR